jgi:transcriptional regulator of arginine metabolism
VIAQTLAGRRQLILDILGRRSVRSQGELLEILSQQGFSVTQATLSRDLVELGAVKVREGRTLVYAVPGEGGDRTARVAPGPEEVSSRLRRQCEELLVTARVSGSLVVVRTPSGAANYLASALDHADETDILGTIAGDDTILIITSAPSQAQAMATRLLALAGRDQPTNLGTMPDPTDKPRDDARIVLTTDSKTSTDITKEY